MSVLRVITRIIPLNENNTPIEPVPLEVLSDGAATSRKSEIIELAEPHSGLKYRIERIEEIQDVEPGETVESVNKTFSNKLKEVPGFVQLKESNTQLNSYDKCLQLSVPKVISLMDDNEGSDTLTVSVVKNTNFKKHSFVCKKSRIESSGQLNKNESSNDSIASQPLFRSKYPFYLQRKLNNIIKLKRRRKAIFNFMHLSKSKYNNVGNTSDHAPSFKFKKACEFNVRRAKNFNIDQTASECSIQEMMERQGCSCDEDVIDNNSLETASMDKSDVIEDSVYDLEYGDLIINVPETHSENEQVFHSKIINDEAGITEKDGSSFKHSNIIECVDDICVINESDSLQISTSNAILNDNVCFNIVIPVEHPLHDFLQHLMKYFVSGECLICGFIPTDANFNVYIHMESHISTNSSFCYYKCTCCNERFCSPRNLYKHALSREKLYNYMCSICLIKFKRRHYLMRHSAKSHKIFNK